MPNQGIYTPSTLKVTLFLELVTVTVTCLKKELINVCSYLLKFHKKYKFTIQFLQLYSS